MDYKDKKAFCEAMEKNFDELHLLKLKYLAAQIREAELKDLFDKTYKEVLEEHEFFASESKNPKRAGLEPGDRITDIDNAFLMGDADFNIYLYHAQEKQIERGYANEDGTYKPGFNGLEIKMNAQNELIDFQISILPDEMKEAFKDIKKSYIHTHKFLDLIMNYGAKGDANV